VAILPFSGEGEKKGEDANGVNRDHVTPLKFCCVIYWGGSRKMHAKQSIYFDERQRRLARPSVQHLIIHSTANRLQCTDILLAVNYVANVC